MIALFALSGPIPSGRARTVVQLEAGIIDGSSGGTWRYLSVVGETTNLASRLQVQAAAGEVLLSAEAHRRVNDWLRGQGIEASKDRMELKGLAEPVTAYRLKAPTLV